MRGRVGKGRRRDEREDTLVVLDPGEEGGTKEGFHRVTEATVAVEDRGSRSVVLEAARRNEKTRSAHFQDPLERKRDETHSAGLVINMGTLVPSLLS